MTVLPPSDLSTPVSSSRILNVTWKVHHKANSSSTTDVNLSEIDHDNGSEKGYSSDPGFISKLVRKARRLGRSIYKSKRASYALPSESPADVPVPVITIDNPESTGTTIVRESDTVQLLQPEGGTHPPQPPFSYPADTRNIDQPSPLVASTLRHDIFLADAPKPTVRATVPADPRAVIVSTLQLVHCARLLLEGHHPSTSQSSPTGVGIFDDDDAVRHWLEAIQEDPSAQARIRWLVSRLVKEFRSDLSPEPEVIFEVVVLGPVLCEVDYRNLLSCFIERFDQSALLNLRLLQGMIHLLQSAPSGFLTDDDLVRTMSSLRKRLESTHAPDRTHVYQLVFAVSKVLEVMVKGDVKGLNRQRDHQSLLAALRNLKDLDNDEFLKFQVSYAYQMSLYLPDDETSFQAFWRYAESVAVGVSAVASVFKLDPMSALAAVEHIQQVAGNAIDVVKFNIDGALAFQATAEGVTQAAEKANWSQKKQPWFLALQAGYLFVQDGRLVDFNVLVCDATRRYDVNFQRGVCQILGEIALNPLWDDGSRRSAVDFLGELCKIDAGRKKDFKVRRWVATILQQISSSTSPDISDYARILLDHLKQEHAFDIQECRALHTLLPIPTVFPLLKRALNITDIDRELACIQFRSLEECLRPISIPLRAKATLLAPEDQSFPLMAKVLEFLRSNNLVFLLLGDSGSGKSTFCRQLQQELWKQHGDGGKIPLYINLPSIDDPHCDLIGKYLRLHHNISETTIQEIKHHRKLVLICDGYDESRLIQNLYTTNRLNQPGQWNVKMIVTCRSTFLSPDYHTRFYPLEDDIYRNNSFGLFEEATIVPFQKSDIQEFVKQYVATQKPSDNPFAPSFDDYWKNLSVIPNVMNLASNPFLLTLALRAIPSKSIEALDSKGLKAMQHDLYDGFMQEWTRLQKIRLQGTMIKQDIRAAAFESLLGDGFSWRVIDYLKRLADAIYKYQDGRPIVKFSRRHMEDWKVKFFGPEIETTLLRDASPLRRAGIRHWFIHKSLLDYFYNLTFYDPDESDDDDSDDSEDGDDDSRGGGDDFHIGGGNSLGDGGDGLADNNGDLAGGNEGPTGGNAQSTDNNGGSSGGNGGSTSGNQDSSGGGSNQSGGNSGSSSEGNNNGSRGDKNGSNGNEDGSRRRKDDARSKRKGNATKSRPSTSRDPFSKRNLFKELSVLQFLAERAESDPRLKKRLFSAIEQAKASSVPSMAAANAITILFKSKNLFEDAGLDGVSIPSDYMSTATGITEPVQLPESNLTGGDLMKVLVTLTTSQSVSTVPVTALTVPILLSTGPAPTPHNAHSTASKAYTNFAFENIGRAANEAVQPSSMAKNRSISRDFAAITVKGILGPFDQTSGDAIDDTENKPVSSQHVRKRDKIFNFFRSPSSERKVEKAQSSSPKVADNRLSTSSTEATLHHLSTASTQDSGDIEHEDFGSVEIEFVVSRCFDMEHVVSTTEAMSPVSNVQASALSAKLTVTVFSENMSPPVVSITLPKFGSRINTTPQLALCIGLLPKGSDPINQEEHFPQVLSSRTATKLSWIKSMKHDPVEQEHIRWLGTRMVDEFAKDASKDSTEIAEMVLIGPVLDSEHYRRLLSCIITAFDQAVLLDVDLLQGLVQLVQSAPSEVLLPDDLVKILRVLRIHLQDTHLQSSVHPFHLTLAVSRLLDVMAEHKVKDLDRVEDHEPLSGVLSGLRASSDPYVMYQACYAFQALQYVPNNETPLQAVLRHSTGVVDGLVKVSAVFKLDLGEVLEGLGKLQDTLGDVVEVAGTVYTGACSLMESGRGVFESMKEGLGSGQKRLWYAAIRTANALAQAGRLKDLNTLIYKVPCRRDPLFQWGICQLLGEIASDNIWDPSIRLQAVDLLGELYKNAPLWGEDESVRTWMVNIIRQLCVSTHQAVSGNALALLKELNQDQNIGTHLPYPLRNRLPLPASSPTLARVQNILPLEYDINKRKVQRLEESHLSLYIQPFAKASLRSKVDNTFPLLEKVLEFLASERQVMLILGDSGSGKSTFNRHLEHRLWTDYKQGGPIPLFINLPAIDRPDQDLIAKHLRANNFTEDQIQEMKQHRQFILICDGYDESQQRVNLHRTNMLNQPGQWSTKMVISCRTQFLGLTYFDRFKPLPADRYTPGSQDLFLEAVIAPFSKDQIENYVEQYANSKDPQTTLLLRNQVVWSAKEYMDKLTTIPSVKDLIKNPFLLTLALKALPRLVAASKDLSSIRVTRVGLYDMFVDQWLETNQLRLRMSTLSKEELTALDSLADDDFMECGINYLLQLSAAIFQEQDGYPVVQYIHRRDKDSWKAAFFGSDPEVRLLRHASPLMRTGNQYRFVHSSLLEYFLSRVIYNPAKVDEQGFDSSMRTTSPASLTCDTNSPLYQRNLLEEPLIIQFLCDRVSQDPIFEQQLRAVIDQSKTNSSAATAATNAITILVKAGIAFHGADLRGIKIPGADLSYGKFDSAQLQGADLRGVNLLGSWLRQADLSHAQLDGVQFGELPHLKEEGEVQACVFSPDGGMLGVALWADGLGVVIYDTSTWQRIHLAATTERVRSLAFSPDSRRIVFGAENGVIRVWDCTSGEELLVMNGGTDTISSLEYSPCGNRIASACSDNTVRLWNSKTGVCMFVLENHTDKVLSVKFTPDGRQLVSGSWDETIRFWDSETGESGNILRPLLGWIYSLACSPKGRWIASGHYGGDVWLWDMVSGSRGPVLQGHTDLVTGIAFSPKDQLIASSSRDRRVMLWDASTGDCISTYDGHLHPVWDVAFSPDGLTIASGSDDETVHLWKVNSSRSSIAIQNQIDGALLVAYSPDGLSVLSIDSQLNIRQWDATTGLRGSVSCELPDMESFKCLTFSTDVDQIATGCEDGTVRLWDRKTGAAGPVLEGHLSEVYDMTYSTCGRWIASHDVDGFVRLWDLRDTKQQCVLVKGGGGEVDWISDLKFSPTGDQLAICWMNGIVQLFDPETRALLMSKELTEDQILALGYSPNGQQLALSTETSIAFWDLESDEFDLKLKVPPICQQDDSDHIVTYSPCGQFLASTGAEYNVHLWYRRLVEGNTYSWGHAISLGVFSAKLISLSWNPVVPAEFITSCRDEALQVWRVSSDEGTVAVKMLWGTNLRSLCTAGVVLDGATGLIPIHRKLLAQRGSVFPQKST